ncbi:hypothetical protein [uncultured Phascolarctobacterium sp.]|uniref:hypothetical protein n=1 Tax=uncultured Phascolarctobacterium sp. TaxID=512296 RepID=UPI0025D49B0D|nr:hypothetical protein [uncultured Phascolarctobacterium sp.]
MNAEDIKNILRNIPNSVSGDGKTFVAALKNYLTKYGLVTDEKIDSALEELTKKPNHVDSITLLELHAIMDGVRSNNVQINWDSTPVSDYAKAEIWYTRSADSSWEKAGEASGTQYVLQGVAAGETYYIRVIAVNSKGVTADFDTAPIANITIKGSQYIPAPPTQFVLTWDEQGPLWKWLFEDNNYVDFFELRLDQNPGVWNDKRLDSTRETWSRANPEVRSGTAYLYIRNIFGEYSEPAVHEFNKAMGGKPAAPILTATLDGVNIEMAGLPLGYTHYKIHIVTSDGEDDYYTTSNSEYIYFFFSGTITVSYCFVDDISDGEWSDTVQADVKTLMVNAENIADNAVTAAKIRANSIDASKIQAGAVTAEKIEAGAITAEKLAAGSVTSDAIQAGSVIGEKIAANAITGKHFAAENIDLTGALSITGGNVKLSEEGLRLTGGDNSYTLFNAEGINYIDKNGVVYAQVKKMIIGKAYDNQYIKFAAPWAKPPTVLMSPMSIKVNDSDYSASSLYLVCEATDVSINGFKVNSYLRLADDSYGVNNIAKIDTPSEFIVESMEQYWYGHYSYAYTFVCRSDVSKITIPSTAKYIELSLQLDITNPFSNNAYVYVKYPGANSGWTKLDNNSRTVTVQLIVANEVLQEVPFTIGDGTSTVIKNFILSASFNAGATEAIVRVIWKYKLKTGEHGSWQTIYNGKNYIAEATCKCTLKRTYYKIAASNAKIARGYATFLVTDGSTNIYLAEVFVKVLINYDGSPLVSKAVSVSGESYTTDADGYIEMKGSDYKEYTFVYGTAPPINATVAFTDGVVTTVNIAPANVTCYIKVTYDGKVVANQTVKLNNVDKTTDENGKIAVGGLDNHSGEYTVAYKNDSVTITVNYIDGSTTTAELFELQDGSKEWTWQETSYKNISFAIPGGAHRIKIEASVDWAEGEPYAETSASIINTANKKVWGNGYSYAADDGQNYDHKDIDSIVAVTPGKTYNLLFDCASTNGVKFSWGREIDKMIATVVDDEE